MRNRLPFLDSPARRVVVFGLDGVSHDMILRLVSEGVMPALADILRAGALCPMRVPLPEISSVSWSSFMTGVDPGSHGIFGFVDLKPNGYSFYYPDFDDLGAEPFFHELGRYNRRSVIINLPSTYPARPLPGVLISGFVAAELERAVFPRSYEDLLASSGYRVDVEMNLVRERPLDFFCSLHTVLSTRWDIAERLWTKEPWDVFLFIITGTDRLNHFFFDAFQRPDHDFSGNFRRYYRYIDRIIGEMYRKISAMDNTSLIMLSDHGFGPVKKEIYLNPILQNLGLLSISGPVENGIDNMSLDSRAFALDPSRIYVHRQGRFLRGRVRTPEANRIVQQLKAYFSGYTIAGQKVIRRVHTGTQLYQGPYLTLGPDLVLEAEPGFDLKAGFKEKVECKPSRFAGMHRSDNAFFFTTKPEGLPETMRMCEVKKHLFDLLGIVQSN